MIAVQDKPFVAQSRVVVCWDCSDPEGGDLSFELLDNLPDIGAKKYWGGLDWKIVDTYLYQSPSSLLAVATCTLDGNYSHRQDKSSGKRLLYYFTGRNGEITASDFDPDDDDGHVHLFGVSTHFKYLPKVGETPPGSYGWKIEAIEEFMLTGDLRETPATGRPPAGFDAVYVCWCQSVETAAA